MESIPGADDDQDNVLPVADVTGEEASSAMEFIDQRVGLRPYDG